MVVRLVGGGNVTSQGRVEVFHRGTWGRVCFDYWDSRDANVVCRQLGFEGALSATSSAAFGKGKGIVWMDNVNCAGNESSLSECEYNQGPSVYCSRYQFAGVVCTTGRKTFSLFSIKLFHGYLGSTVSTTAEQLGVRTPRLI